MELSNALSSASTDHNAAALEANDEAHHLLNVASSTYTQQGGTGQQAQVAGYAEPLLAFSSPAGILSATPKSQQLASGQHLHLSSQQDTNLAIGKRLAMAVKEAWSVFVATSGIKLFAGKGKVEIQAQGDALEMTAKQDVKITSVDGHVFITAPNLIRLTAGGCQIEVGNGQISFKAPGVVNIHGSVKNLTGPATVNSVLPKLPNAPLPDALPLKFDIRITDIPGPTGIPIPHMPWRIVHAYGPEKALESDKLILEGESNDEGKVALSDADEKALTQAYNASPSQLWLVYGGQVREMILTRADDDWSDQQKRQYALDAMGYSDQLTNTAGSATEDLHGKLASREHQTKAGSALLKKLLGGK